MDGVRIVFQLTPGTEAPAEMNFHFPERRALCLAENATHNLHNILTLGGAPVRDARVWARYLDEAITLFADDTDVAFASHHWPTWGRDAKDALADVYQRLGEGAENGTWRNFYLTGSLEFREGAKPFPTSIAGEMAAGLTVEQVFDSMAIRVNGPRHGTSS